MGYLGVIPILIPCLSNQQEDCPQKLLLSASVFFPLGVWKLLAVFRFIPVAARHPTPTLPPIALVPFWTCFVLRRVEQAG